LSRRRASVPPVNCVPLGIVAVTRVRIAADRVSLINQQGHPPAGCLGDRCARVVLARPVRSQVRSI
jgi:hypothetical protein